MLFHDAIALNRNGREVAPSCVSPARAHPPSMHEMLTQLWPILTSTVVMRRQTFQLCGGFSEEFKFGYEDPDLWIRAREHGHFIYMAESLTYYTLIEERTERMEKYLTSQAVFFRRLRQRYGDAAEELIRRTVRSYTNWLGYQGLLAMQAGDRAAARGYFARILRRQPTHMKSALRYLRTFLPAPIVHPTPPIVSLLPTFALTYIPPRFFLAPSTHLRTMRHSDATFPICQLALS